MTLARSVWVLVIAALSCQHPPGPFDLQSDFQTLHTACWANRSPDAPPYALRYRSAPNGEYVRFALVNQSAIDSVHTCSFRFDYDTKQLVTEELAYGEEAPLTWPGVGGALGLGRAPGGLICGTGDRRGVKLEGECQPSHGRFLTGVHCSPSNTYCVLLSSDGPQRRNGPSVWGSGGTARTYGQHYLQLVSIDEDRFVGSPLATGIEPGRVYATLGWLGDDEHIVAAPNSREWLEIFSVDDFMRD